MKRIAIGLAAALQAAAWLLPGAARADDVKVVNKLLNEIIKEAAGR